jgi:disulfide bond formation protein DsbB
LTLPGWAPLNWLGFAACAAVLAFAFYAQYGLYLVPCHLCVFQRVTVAGMGVAFLVAALLPGGGWRTALRVILIVLTGLATMATAGRHVWVQMQPEGSVAACGGDLEFMLDILPVTEVILRVLRAGGECAKIDWTLLGLSMPVWVLMFAAVMTVGGIWNNLRRA